MKIKSEREEELDGEPLANMLIQAAIYHTLRRKVCNQFILPLEEAVYHNRRYSYELAMPA